MLNNIKKMILDNNISWTNFVTVLEFDGLVEIEIIFGMVLGVCVLGLFWYYVFWKPFDWFKDMTELGFSNMNHSKKLNDISKKNMINKMLYQKRKIGNDLPPVYPNGWFVILESHDLPLMGVKELYVLGLNLVAWRGNSGKSYVADAYCPHLGAHLGVGGKVVAGDCIKCPFHGWCFDGGLDGTLTNIPYSDSVLQQQSNNESIKIKIRKTMEINGFIYLWFHSEGIEPNWAPELIPEIKSGEWKYRGRAEFIVGCHVQEIAENSSDIAHLNIVHEEALMCGGEPDHSFLQWNFIKHKWRGCWNESKEPEQKHIANVHVEHLLYIFNKISLLQLNLDVKQIGPGITSVVYESIFGRGILFQAVTPIGPLEQKVVDRFYSSKTFIHPFGKLLLLGLAITIERDIRIWNRKIYVSRPLLTKEDKMIKSFRRWYSQFYSENSPRYYFSKNNNENTMNTLDF